MLSPAFSLPTKRKFFLLCGGSHRRNYAGLSIMRRFPAPARVAPWRVENRRVIGVASFGLLAREEASHDRACVPFGARRAPASSQSTGLGVRRPRRVSLRAWSPSVHDPAVCSGRRALRRVARPHASCSRSGRRRGRRRLPPQAPPALPMPAAVFKDGASGSVSTSPLARRPSTDGAGASRGSGDVGRRDDHRGLHGASPRHAWGVKRDVWL